jgi:2-oxoglutarate dehydrogenase E1 component
MNDLSSDNLGSVNVGFVEELYERFLENPSSVSAEWQGYFNSEAFLDGSPARTLQPALKDYSLFNPPAAAAAELASTRAMEDRIDRLVRAYRFRGHMIAEIDPLGQPRPMPDELKPETYGLTETDMDREFPAMGVGGRGRTMMKLRDILAVLRNTYCRSIGVEYRHIDDASIRRWLQERMELNENRIQLSHDQQVRILTKLTDAVMFEEFIRKKFIGAKSFSLEGSESLIPLLDLAIEKAAEQGVTEVDLGMAHRGRLNVLANIMGKHPKHIFREFADLEPEKYRGSGDVKYHLGYSRKWKTATGKQVHISLCFNPSHLEFVNPVVLGRARANSDRVGDLDRRRTMALLIHGDAAFAGQGVIQEILNMSQLPNYSVGGTLHVIVNNQVGFTTSPNEARSTLYATDVAKMLQIPIFHVNGENPEAVAQVVNVAMEFRAAFQRDVIIDVYGYRRLGHNEADEPSFTQPLLYKAIEKRKPVHAAYLDNLLALGGITREEADKISEERRNHLEMALADSKSYRLPNELASGVWANYVGGTDSFVPEAETTVPASRLTELMLKATETPASFNVHPKLKKILEHRRAMARGEEGFDWAGAETLAFASLAADGFRVRLTGQDCGRGTFSQRHAQLHDYETGKVHVPLQHLAPNQGMVDILNSPLSEVGVMGFEYGYSLEWPDGLVAWEAQFGDFVNVAQVMIDQFLISAEKKWRRLSGLVLLLPHGFEGQGPEHSSARLERFLANAAEDNIQVVYPTTPAQYFHLLRRQVVRKMRKPLVVMTPKSLLRHPKVVSSLNEIATGHWQHILPDTTVKPEAVNQILLCSGKVYYDLEAKRQELGRMDTAILRVEQLYPLALSALDAALAPYRSGVPVTWVQEEPENMGGWRYFKHYYGEKIAVGRSFSGISRPASASPATGSANSHKLEQEQILSAAYAAPAPRA